MGEHPDTDAACAHLVTQFRLLQDILHQERGALVERSPEGLERLIARKEALCAEIVQGQRRLMADLDPKAAPGSLDELRELTKACQLENAVNGRIANRARQTTRALLRILTGEPEGDLYERPGRQSVSAPGDAQRPGRGHRLGSA